MEYRHRAFWPPDMPRSLAPARTTLHDMLESAAQRFPGNPATIFQDETLTWAEVRRRVDALAGHLRQECGVRRGDRVLLEFDFFAYNISAEEDRWFHRAQVEPLPAPPTEDE